MLWLAIALMILAAAGALLWPFLRRPAAAASRAAYDLTVYKDQLAELERDRARGLIGGAEADAARSEIARRMLTAGAERGEHEPGARAAAPASRWRVPPGAAVVAFAVPLLALALYLSIGAPRIPDQPFAQRTAEADGVGGQELATLADDLARRLESRPDDLNGWALLARTYMTLGRPENSLAAWRRVRMLAPDDAQYAGLFAESLVQANDGIVTPEALQAFEQVLAVDPFDPRALFYKGSAQAQAGEARGALQSWTDLIHVSPADAPWIQVVRARAAEIAASAKIDLSSVAPSPAAEAARVKEAAAKAGEAPAASDVAAIENLAPEERQAVVRGMVERLAARLESEPGDVEGWRRLGRAWRVLGESAKAEAAYERASELAPTRVELWLDYATALYDGVRPGDRLPPKFIAAMRRVLDLSPDNSDALWFVGLADAEAGDRAAAVLHWGKLLASLPPNSAEASDVKKRLDSLKAEK